MPPFETDRARLRADNMKNSTPDATAPSLPSPGRTGAGHAAPVHHIELRLRDVSQLFNTMDPSPFHEKDLDDAAARFILSWAQEFHLPDPVDLILHLEVLGDPEATRKTVTEAVHHYFSYEARLNRLEFKRLMSNGRFSLLVGFAFLGLCLLLLELVPKTSPSTFVRFLREGLTIAGWVAMWRPLEIYLYEWWPLRRKGRILQKLSRMRVSVRKAS